jgi:small neutral amino acid transporter SnatA (MarC family)
MFEVLFIIGFICSPILIVIPIGFIFVVISLLKKKNKSEYLKVANVSWCLVIIYFIVLFYYFSTLGSGGVSGLMLPPFLVIPEILCLVYIIFMAKKFKTDKSGFLCEVCGSDTTINWGNANHIYCEKHRE